MTMPVCLIWQMKGFIANLRKSFGGLSIHLTLSLDDRSALVHHQLLEERVETWLEVDLPAGSYRIMFVVRGNSYTELRIYDLMLQPHGCSNPGECMTPALSRVRDSSKQTKIENAVKIDLLCYLYKIASSMI